MKKYGLQLRVPPSQKKNQPSRPPLPRPNVFNDEDEDDVEREIARQATKSKSLKDIEEQHKKALEEDPSVFDYDGVYDDMKEKIVRPKAQDRQERKPKYIEVLMEKAKQREREHEIIYERKLAKERSKDDHLFVDKDKFVTNAYKRKMAEQAKWLEEERLRELREEKDDVTKKSGLTDFYFNLSKNVAFGARESELKKPQKQEETETVRQPEKVGSSSNSSLDFSLEKEQHDPSEIPKKTLEPSESKPVEETQGQGKMEDEKQEASQPKQDHHKRSADAVAAAKERFLARKKVKEL
ncbi:Nuclear speckle splicing regulatory protein 1, N-terminal [Dillenia turbinata]|uniref:Nuclear speckle splicing regulatory protein 1, N-terminal n=1 Tax=Dillenia turbinata TaxID=194707 RepID=A0AAN8Z677_9MAGN